MAMPQRSVTVTEYVDWLVLENPGLFYDGKPEDYILGERSPPSYRNPQLVKAMRELNMIDTMGYGIHQMYDDQKRREGLIEGRMLHPHISSVVAEATGQQAEYMGKKELPGSRYREKQRRYRFWNRRMNRL